jgi:hypothetical protein
MILTLPSFKPSKPNPSAGTICQFQTSHLLRDDPEPTSLLTKVCYGVGVLSLEKIYEVAHTWQNMPQVN